MADDVDRAGELAAHEVMVGAANVAAQIHGEGLDECEDCGTEISPARRAAYPAARRCVDCQAGFEAESKRYRRVAI
jgi:phage/conjugal plasmid C-4 type zinc finger TraR family protein